MSSTLDRLRRLQSLRPQKSRPEPIYAPLEDDLPVEPVRPAPPGVLEELAPGDEVITPVGTCYVVTHAYPLAEARGRYALGDLLTLAPNTLAPFHPDFALDDSTDFTQAAFIDTETTGLGAGASVYAFMIGVGVFARATPADPWSTAAGDLTHALGRYTPPTHFVVRQFFMRHPGEESAVLAAVADLLADRQLAVTFNGRTFDLPLLRTRYIQNRRALSARPPVRLLAEGSPHLDLLHPARRLWRRRLQSCRLINLEQMILGLSRSEDDVPGALIPYLYHDFVRTGNAGEMRRVFYHNCEDIVSMVSLAHRLIQAYTAPKADQAEFSVEGEDWLALGVCYERRGESARADWAYRRAIDVVTDAPMRADAFGRLGELLKRQARWDEAAAIWELWLSSVPGVDPTPYVELAKYCEWQLHDLARAEMWTAWALHNLKAAPVYQRLPGQLADLEHRLVRIRRKLGQA